MKKFFFGDGVVLSCPPKLFVLNSTAAFLWNDINEGLALEKANARQAERFGVLPADIFQDSERIYKNWAYEGLLLGCNYSSAKENELVDISDYDVRNQLVFLKSPSDERIRTYHFHSNPVTCGFQTKALENLIHPAFAHLEVKDLRLGDTIINLRMKNDAIVVCCGWKDVVSTFDIREARTSALINILDAISGMSDWCALLHAAALARGDETILLAGACQKGKTTLTAHLLQRNWEYLAEDLTAIDSKSGAVYGIPSALSLKQGSWDLLSVDFPEIENLAIHEKFGSKIRYLPPPKYQLGPKSLKFIIFVDFDPSVKHYCLKLSPVEALENLVAADSWINTDEDHLNFFLEILENVTAFQLTYNTLDQAQSSIEELFL